MAQEQVFEAAVSAVQAGDVAALRRLLAEHPDLVSARGTGERSGRTLLHVATDWPGHFPEVAATITALVEAGADPDARFVGAHTETPLHWAASCNDVAALDALVQHGADVEAPGAVIGGGTPMADATAFGQWEAARRLLEHGCRTNLFEAAALGLGSEVERQLRTGRPSPEDVTSSFWGACHGGQINTATLLLDHGADLDRVGYDGLTPLEVAQRAEATEVVLWLRAQGA